MKPTLLVLICSLLFVAPADARTWLVRQNGSGDCMSIQACVDSAAVLDTVLVGPGTYYENVVMKDGLKLISEHGSAVTTIDGGYSGSVISCEGLYIYDVEL